MLEGQLGNEPCALFIYELDYSFPDPTTSPSAHQMSVPMDQAPGLPRIRAWSWAHTLHYLIITPRVNNSRTRARHPPPEWGGDTKCLVLSTGYQILGTKYLVPSTWLVPSPWYQVLGTKYLVPSTWYQVLGTKYLYLVPSSWYRVLGTEYLVPSTW